jgi:hypothetical protein
MKSSTKSRIFFVFLISISAIICIGFQLRSGTSREDSNSIVLDRENKYNNDASKIKDTVKKLRKEHNRDLAKFIDGIHRKEISPSVFSNSKSPTAEGKLAVYSQQLGIIKASFEKMIALSRSIEREDEKKQILSALAKDPENVLAAAAALEDLGSTKKLFGENQAYARIFSIQLLKAGAQNGYFSPLEEAITKVSEEVSKDPSEKGRKRDLEDLIRVRIELDPEIAMNHLDGFIQSLAYRDGLEQQYVAGIYFGLQNSYSEEEIENALRKTILGEFL